MSSKILLDEKKKETSVTFQPFLCGEPRCRVAAGTS